MSSGTIWHKENAAGQLAQLLKMSRAHLATFRPRVCSVCGYVFSPSGRIDRRCLDCAHEPPTDAPGDDCPDHGPYADDDCPKC